MRPEIVLEHYRIGAGSGQAPVEIGRNGPAVTYKGSDLRTGAPVAVTLIPVASVDPQARDTFEEKARTAMLLDHANIVKTVAFGEAENFFVLVSEYPLGETLDAWVKANGPMPADAVLRVALQVVAALGAASFHGLHHPAIQPANLLIVSGKTAEGGWPYVKLTHFGLAALKSAPGHTDPDLSASDYASPEQLLQGKVDFRSEIYSLGASLCYLLTGVFYSAYPRSPQTRRFARPLRAFIARTLEDDPDARPQDPVLFTEEIRSCLTAIERRQALRQKFGIPFAPVAKPPRLPRFRRLRKRPTSLLAPVGTGAAAMASAVTVAEPDTVVRRSRLRPILAVIGLLLVAGVVAALMLPEDVVMTALHRSKPVQTIGVPVGVPENPPAVVAQSNNPMLRPGSRRSSSTPQLTASAHGSAAASDLSQIAPMAGAAAKGQISSTPPPPPVQPSQPAEEKSAMVAANQTAPNSAPVVEQRGVTTAENTKTDTPASVNETPVASPAPTPVTVAENTRVTEPAAPAQGPESTEDGSTPQPDSSEANRVEDEPAAPGPEPEPPAAVAKPRVASESPNLKRTRKSLTQNRNRPTKPKVPRALPVGPEDEPPIHSGEMKARVVGITPAGNVILALPNGERAIVAPQDADQYAEPKRAHRRPHRVIIERRTVYPPGYYPPYQPFIPPDA